MSSENKAQKILRRNTPKKPGKKSKKTEAKSLKKLEKMFFKKTKEKVF